MSVQIESRQVTSGRTPSCRFCAVDEREAALVESEFALAIPSLGSLVEGWVLVVPRTHVLSLAEVARGDQHRFSHFVDRVRALMGATYGRWVEFEHGPGGLGRLAGCGVDHAHLHLVPVDVDLREAARGLDPTVDSLRWTSAEWPWSGPAASGTDYLYVRDVDGSSWLAHGRQIPSQLFRRVIARHVGSASWDWKDPGTTDMQAATRARLSAWR